MRLYVEDFVSPEIGPSSEVALDKDRSHYLCRVRRAANGDVLTLFDGLGNVAHATLVLADKRAALVRIDTLEKTPAEEVQLSLLLCHIKGDAADRALQKSVELGVSQIHLLASSRSNVAHTEKRMQHLQRVTISACEQCGQNYLPQLHLENTLEDVLTTARANGLQIVCLQPGSPPLPANLPRRHTLVCIGPEGGWSDEELTLFDPATLAGLGDLVLRAETAPLAALAAIRGGWGWR